MHGGDTEAAQGAALLLELGALIAEGRDVVRGRPPKLSMHAMLHALWLRRVRMRIEVLMVPPCKSGRCRELLLERWTLSLSPSPSTSTSSTRITSKWLLDAVRSQLHFSQISAWAAKLRERRRRCNVKKFSGEDEERLDVVYEVRAADDDDATAGWLAHEFPPTDIGGGALLEVLLETPPRADDAPRLTCDCDERYFVDDRMRTPCLKKGKHRCSCDDDAHQLQHLHPPTTSIPILQASRFDRVDRFGNFRSTVFNSLRQPDCSAYQCDHAEPDCPLDADEPEDRLSCKRKPSEDDDYRPSAKKLISSYTQTDDVTCECGNSLPPRCFDCGPRLTRSEANHDLASLQSPSSSENARPPPKCDSSISDRYKCDNNSVKSFSRRGDRTPLGRVSDNPRTDDAVRAPKLGDRLDAVVRDRRDRSFKRAILKTAETEPAPDLDERIVYERGEYDAPAETPRSHPKRRTSVLDPSSVPSTSEMDKFRYRLDSAASMVFHSRTGLPLTSSPAPLRRGKSSFDFDSSINSVSSIKSALYGSSDLDSLDSSAPWSPGSSPGSPNHTQVDAPVFNYSVPPKSVPTLSLNKQSKFRHGTSSGLLGSFEESVLNGRLEPAATVAGFTAEIGASGNFCPSHLTLPVTVFFYSLGDNTTSSPYLGHINLGRKGYCVPRTGTIQVTLFNPHGTVVKMFVVMYDLEDMPPYSRTFLRQRTLWGGTCLRYLIHLRFLSSKSGKVYLHTDIRIIVSRKADLDTAAAHSLSSTLKFPRDEKTGKKYPMVETGTFERRSKRDRVACEKKVLHSNASERRDVSVADSLRVAASDVNRNKYTSSVPTAISKELSYELRSFTYGPKNPKYSPR